ncbi:glycosyl hydrolase [Actinoplanes sp. NPDC049548]|uniref:glycosyl hydrolase n=1 Tax=Actinoplanes sp. NPDC049548 TaxID=3155152 RepID=UPI0034324063
MGAVIAAGVGAMPDAGAETGPAGNDAAIVGVAGKCVDVAKTESAGALPVQLWDCNGTDRQRWEVDEQQGTVRALDKCLGVADGASGDGTAVQLLDCTDTDARRWRFTNGQLLNTGSGKCLDAHDGDDNGVALQIWKCATSATQTWKAPSVATGQASAKKGVSTWPFPRAADGIRDVGAGWYHDWSSDNEDIPAQAEFVATIWGPGSVTDAELAAAKKSSKSLLGFHEPDSKDQADLTVEKALELWPRLEETGLRLGSPAVASGADVPDGWLDRFMSGAREKKLRVDFIALHWFGSDFSDAAADQLMDYVQRVHERYDMPIWVTQFGLTNFTGEPRYPDAKQLTTFLTKATKNLDATPYVERYAYSSLPATADSEAYGLYCEDGTLTEAGVAYRDAGTPGAVPSASGDPQPSQGDPQPSQETAPPSQDASPPSPSTQENPRPSVEPSQPKDQPEASGDAALEDRMIELINVERAKAQCQPVVKNDVLTATARAHSKLMAERKERSHKFPDEQEVGDRITAGGYTWSGVAENIVPGAFVTPEIAMYGKHDPTTDFTGLMEDSAHRGNMLNCGYKDVGVGVVRDSDGGPWWTQDFGSPR